MVASSLYFSETIAISTMHAKERAVSRPLQRWLGAAIKVAPGIDTDLFGTFTGEQARVGSMLDAARAKAQAAIKSTGLPFGLGSEGSFGPHPTLPFLAGGTEVLLFVDLRRGLEVCETLVTHRTNYRSLRCRPNDDIDTFLRSVRFPSHAVVVTANDAEAGQHIVKGIKSRTALSESITRAASVSRDSFALITADMRAHLNPTRMATIRALASRLARRLATSCPACASPGFGAADIVRGLPCGWCGEPTPLATAVVHRCIKCEFKSITTISNGRETADPGQCQHCNP